MAENATATVPLPKPDAIRAPRSGGGGFAQLTELHAAYAAVLEVPRIYVREQGAEHFITGDPNDSLYFPGDSQHAGVPRYRWVDQGDGVAFGYLWNASELPGPDAAVVDMVLKLRDLQAKRAAAARAGTGAGPTLTQAEATRA